MFWYDILLPHNNRMPAYIPQNNTFMNNCSHFPSRGILATPYPTDSVKFVQTFEQRQLPSTISLVSSLPQLHCTALHCTCSLVQVHLADSTARLQLEGCASSPAGVPRAVTRSLVCVWTADSVTMVIRVATTGEGQPAR